MNTFNDFRTQFSDFYEVVKKGHRETLSQNHGGHGLDHDVTVAMLAVLIQPSVRIAHKAWCAALLHSVDRVVEESFVKETMLAYAEHLHHFFSQEEIDEIIESAMRHSELNQDNQSETQITLMDADRLANMQSAVIIRGGQFRSKLPVFDFKYLEGVCDPLSDYDHPQSVVDNIRLIVSQYVPQLRLPKAKELGVIYGERLMAYVRSIEQDYEDINLIGIEL